MEKRRNSGDKLNVKAKSINFMLKHKNSWRNAGEIPPGFLPRNFAANQMKSVFFYLTSTVHV